MHGQENIKLFSTVWFETFTVLVIKNLVFLGLLVCLLLFTVVSEDLATSTFRMVDKFKL